MKKLYLVSLGCTKNLVDSEVMLGKLSDYSICDDVSEADLIIVNTCGFIQSAKEESLDTIFQLHQQRKKDSLLVMSGCLSQRYQEQLQDELPEVDIFTGVGDYDKIDQLVQEKKSQFSDKVFLMDKAYDRVVSTSSYHCYIKLSEGCNQTCSFCAIPNFKGKLQSRDLVDIVAEVKNLTQQGFFDFSFVSQDSSSYLRDKGVNNGLEMLIDEIEKIEGVKSARILYLYPSTTTINLIEKIGKSSLFHSYFDIPLQHISPKLLKIMKRGKGTDQIKELLTAMRNQPNSFIRTTFIVGHPFENEENFEDLCDFVEEFGFDRANVFSYSDEEDTISYEMDSKIPQNIIDSRAEVLGEIITNNLLSNLKKEIGTTVDVVVSGISDEHEYLLSAKKLLWGEEIDGEIYINDKDEDISQIEFGKIYKAYITDIAGDKLLAKIIR